eukprot:806113-Rhodomonas_salina.1
MPAASSCSKPFRERREPARAHLLVFLRVQSSQPALQPDPPARDRVCARPRTASGPTLGCETPLATRQRC